MSRTATGALEAKRQQADGDAPSAHNVDRWLRRTPQHRTFTRRSALAVLRQPLINTFRGWLDLNGPVLDPASICSSPSDRISRNASKPSTHVSARIRQRPSSGVSKSRPLTSTWRQRLLSSTRVLNALGLQPDTFAFVDMGSGKGRALLVASEFAFAKIVGIELSPHLHHIAEENIRRYSPASQQCTAFQLHCMNVVDYVYGPEPLVLFLFDPFGRETLRSVVANLEASLRANPREAFVVYIYPQFEEALQSSRVLRKVREGGPRWRPWSRYVVYAAAGR